MTRSRLLAALVATGTACIAVAVAPSAALASAAQTSGQGHHAPSVRVLDRTVIAPFQLDVAKGKLYVADGGTTTVSG